MQSHATVIFTALLAITLTATGCKREEKYLTLDPASVEVSSEAQSAWVSVEASASWMSYNAAGWLQSYMEDGRLRIVIETENESLEPRNTDISIIAGDGQTLILPVLQLAKDVQFSVSPSSLQPFDGKGTILQTLTVATNLSVAQWEYFSAESWLRIEPDTNDMTVLNISASPSTELEPRKDTIVLRPNLDAYWLRTDSIPVVQEGVNLVAEGAAWDTNNRIEIAADAVELVLSVKAIANWTVMDDDTDNRLTLSANGGGSDPEYGVPLTVSLPENDTTNEYRYILAFICEGESYEYTVVQSAPEVP